MYNKKVLIDALKKLGSAKVPPNKKDIIYDPKGQLKYPGQNTRIPSGDITMQGVPYPVYAQPNVGQPQMMQPDQNYHFPGADYVDEFPQMRKGGRTKGLVSMPKPSKKGLLSKSYSRSLDATNKFFTQNYLFAKPKSRKNKVFDPNSKYYAEGGEPCPDGFEYIDGNCIEKSSLPLENCEDGRCKETDQIQHILDEGSYIPKKNVNIMWDVVDQSSIPELSGGDRKNARNIWTSKGAQLLSKRLGMDNPANCMWAAGMGYQCLPETKGQISLMPFESNDKFINAVNKGTIPFSRVAKTNNPNFASKETGMLRQGDIINFKGPNVSHAMTFSNYDDFGKPIFLDSNGNESDLNWNKGLWKNIIPGKETVAYVSRFDPEKFYKKDIKSLEEKARNNPTMIEKQYGGLHKFVGGGKPCDSGYYWNGKKCVLDTSNWEQSSLDSLNLYNKGEKSSGLYSMNYGLAGNHRALWRNFSIKPLWRNESIKPLPEGYTVPGTIQPIGQRVTQASFPLYVFANPPARMAGTQTQYRKRVRDIYAKPVGVQKKPVVNKEPIVEKKIEEKIENLPILKPGLIQQQKYQLQGNPLNEEELELPNEEVESEYLNEGGPDTENPMEWVNKKRRYIDWNGKHVSYRLPRFRKPGSYGDLIKPGKKRYFHLPTIESRNEIYLRPKKQDGGVTKTKLSDKEEKTFQKFYNTLPNNLQSDDDTYDIRGYWDSEGRPEEFNYDQPKQDDGYYHAYSINQNTGEYLKSPAHNTFQHAIDEDRKMGYRPLTNVYGRNIAIENSFIADPEEQSFLRNTEGPANYIEADLDEDEIEEYRRGGYRVEEIDNFQKGGISKVSSNFSDNTKVNYQKPLVKSFNRSNNLESFYKKEREKDLQKQKNATAYHNKTNKISNNFTPKAKENLKKSPVIDNKYFINSQKNPIPMPDGYKPENTKLESIEMLYPEKYVIGPGGGLAGLGMKASKAAFAFKPISYLPSVGKALTYHSVYDATTEHIPNTVKLVLDKSKWNNDKSVELFKNLFKITSTAAGFSKYDKLKHFNRARNLGQFIDKETDANKDALKGAKMFKNFVTTFKKYGGQQF